MSIHSDREIMNAREVLAKEYGSPIIPKRANLYLTPDARLAGETLAIYCGLSLDRAATLSPLEIATFYSVTGSADGPEAGRRMAGRMNPKVTHSSSLPSPTNSEGLEALVTSTMAGMAETLLNKTELTVEQRLSIWEASLGATVAAELEKIAPRPVTITVNELPSVTFQYSHPRLELLIRMAAQGEATWLCGPRGSGKSMAARQVAKALDVSYYIMTGADDATDLLGYHYPHNGQLKVTPFRDAWINGGVVVFDEMDTYNPSAIICINDALANRECTFPDGSYKMNEKFVAIAGTNTDGRGATNEYSARTVIDGATRDRFAFITWNYDREMETALGSLNPAWTSYVQAVRDAFDSLSMEDAPSPRASIKGAGDIAAGCTWAEAAEMRIWKGMAKEYQQRIADIVPMRDYERNCPVTLI